MEEKKIKSMSVYPGSTDGELRVFVNFLPAKTYKRGKVEIKTGLAVFKKEGAEIVPRDGVIKITLAEMFQMLKSNKPLTVKFEENDNYDVDTVTIIKISV